MAKFVTIKNRQVIIDYDKMNDYYIFDPIRDGNGNVIEGIYFKGKTLDDVLEKTEIYDNYLLIHLKNEYIVAVHNYFLYMGDENTIQYLMTDEGEDDTQKKYNIIEEGFVTNPNIVSTVTTLDDGTKIVNGTVFNDTIAVSGVKSDLTIYGGYGHDTITATAYDDTIYGEYGNDIITAGKGDDIIEGGEGDDTISGGLGTNTVIYTKGDGLDTIQLTKDENLKINIIGIAKNELSFDLGEQDLTINYIDTSGEEPVETPIIVIEHFADWDVYSKGAASPIYGAETSSSAAYGYPSMFAEAAEKEYIPTISAILMFDGDEEHAIDLVNATDLYRVEITEDYTGKWMSEIIDASEADGVVIDGKSGDDIIIGSPGDDTIKGNFGDNTIVYNKEIFGFDQIILTPGADLTIDVSELPVTKDSFTYLHYGNRGLLVTYKTYERDEDGNIIYVDGEPVEVVSSMDFIDIVTSKMIKDSGKVQMLFGDGSTLDLKRDVLEPAEYTNKNYKGNLYGNAVIAWLDAPLDTKNKGLTIKTDYGNDIVWGTDYNDTINTDADNDTIYGSKGYDTITGGTGENTIIYASKFDDDTIKLTKGENLTIDLTAFGYNKNDITYEKSGKNYIIGTSKGNIILVNFAASDVTTSTGGVKILLAEATATTPEVSVDLRNDIFLDKIEVTGNFTGTWLSEDIDASDAPTGVTINGGAGNDKITGSDFKDTIKANSGDNTIIAGEGNDIIYAGKGSDTIIYTDGDDKDQLNSATSNTTLSVHSDNDLVYIKRGNALEIVTDFDDTTYQYDNSLTVNNYFNSKNKVDNIKISGVGDPEPVETKSLVEEINNEYLLQYGNKTLTGAKGYNNFLVGTSSNDTINGGDLDDLIYTNIGNDKIKGGTGTNTIMLYTSKDFGTDTITLTKGETLRLKLTDVTVNAYNYTDTSFSGKNLVIKVYDTAGYNTNGSHKGNLKGQVTINNFLSSDVVTNEGGIKLINAVDNEVYDYRNDLIMNVTLNDKTSYTGYWLDDRVDASDSAKGVTINLGGAINYNSAIGSDYADKITGGDDDDVIEGGEGNDTLTGKAGMDTFVFSKGDGKDTITDADKYDRIEITDVAKADLRYLKSGNNLEIYYDDTFDVDNRIIVQNYFKNSTHCSVKASDGVVDMNSVDIYINGSGKLAGTDNNDIIIGGKGKDTITTEKGNDEITPNAGNDVVTINNTGEKTITINKMDGNDTIVFDLFNVGLTTTNKSITNIVLPDLDLASEFDYKYKSNYYDIEFKITYPKIGDSPAVNQTILVKNFLYFVSEADFELQINGEDWLDAIIDFEPVDTTLYGFMASPSFGNQLNSNVTSWLTTGDNSYDIGTIPAPDTNINDIIITQNMG